MVIGKKVNAGKAVDRLQKFIFGGIKSLKTDEANELIDSLQCVRICASIIDEYQKEKQTD